jgi:exopolyphosphatase/pppGpp-phosphohydrolase
MVKTTAEHHLHSEDSHTSLPHGEDSHTASLIQWRQPYSITEGMKTAIQHYHHGEDSHTALPSWWRWSHSITKVVKTAIQHYHHGPKSKIKPFHSLKLYVLVIICRYLRIQFLFHRKQKFLQYKNKLVNTVPESKCYLLSESHKRHKYMSKM